MQITVAAVGTRLEPWINDLFEAYRARLPRHLRLELVEIPLARQQAGAGSAIDSQGERLLRHVRPDAYVLALDERGEQWSSRELAAEFERWQGLYSHVAILIGGPDGLSGACKARADRLWSLSRLTFPHGLVRVLLAEQLYRAWTILQGHPYHRE